MMCMICLLQIDETLSEPIAARLYYKPARGSTQQLSAVQDVVERCYREHGIAHATLVYDTPICSGKNNQMEIGA